MTYYDKISQGYSELHGDEQMNKARIILDRIKPTPSDTLLDVGCGDAAYLDMFDCKAVGIDPSKQLIARYKGKHKLIVGSAEKLPFKDKQFDIVISITALQNFTDIEKGISEMVRVSKKRLAVSILKRSPKAEWVEHLLEKKFVIVEKIVEDKDFIYILTRKD